MSTQLHRAASVAFIALVSSAFGLGACSSAPDEADSEELVGAPEDIASDEDAISGNQPVGSTLIATTDVNLRTGPSTSYSVLHVVPNGATVTLVESAPQNGFYKIKHSGTVGWSSGQYYKLQAAGGGGGLSAARSSAISRAKSAVGFSYWWGHGRFLVDGPSANNKGSCSGSCPSCSHSGSYGGDCSGLAGKVWQVSGADAALSVDQHPYSTVSFNKDTNQWYSVARANMVGADAMVYNSDGAGHIFIYSSGDGWGSMYAYECKGCSAGCVYNLRTASNAYHGIRRSGW